MTNKLISPSFYGKSFTCPHCGVLAKQDRNKEYWGTNWCIYKAICQHCNKISIWFTNNVHVYQYQGNCEAKDWCDMYYPKQINVSLPNDDLENWIKEDYLEAAKIVQDSPRWACALLRLALQKLMIQVWEKWKDINKDIWNLVKNWLSPTIQKALDTVRVIGNESIHPWILDLKDDFDTANKMFWLINIIASFLITQPKEIQSMYWSLPEDKLDGITQRDS